MKKTFLLIALCSFIFGFSQKENKRAFEPDTSKVNEFELDVTNVIKTAIAIDYYGSSATTIGSPYLISYRRYLKKDFDIHTGIGITGSKSESSQNDTINSTDNHLSINYGIGFSHYTSIGAKIKLFYGVDAQYGYNLRKNKNESPSNNYKRNDTEHTIGGAPFLGLQFYLHPRISLSTQTSFNVLYSWEESSQMRKDDDFPSNNYENNTTGSGISSTYTLPLNIQMRVRF